MSRSILSPHRPSLWAALVFALLFSGCAHSLPPGGGGGIAHLQPGQPAPYECLCLDEKALQANEAHHLACERKLEHCREEARSPDWQLGAAFGFVGGALTAILIAWAVSQ